MSDSKKVWKGVRQLINLKSRSGSSPTKLLVEDVERGDPKSMAGVFNNVFTNTGDNLTKNIPSVNKSPLQYLTVPSILSISTTTVEIENEISGLNAKKSTGPYSIPVAILKATKNFIFASLEIIFNASFSTGIVPDLFKIAKVTPVFKKGDQRSLKRINVSPRTKSMTLFSTSVWWTLTHSCHPYGYTQTLDEVDMEDVDTDGSM